MTYRHLNWNAITDSDHKNVFEHTDMYLFDVYGMFRVLPPVGGDGGGGNFSAALVLLCVIDGLATKIWPTDSTQCEQEKRFKSLVRCKLPWGPEGQDKWVDKGNAADQLYTEFRNPLVHAVAEDAPASSRPRGFCEPVIGKWGSIPSEMQDIEKIDALTEWNNKWPILASQNDRQGSRYKLTVAALYWGVKRMAEVLLEERMRTLHTSAKP